jgi:two-component system cell cycle sensor histidine kinase/response regulator CckA
MPQTKQMLEESEQRYRSLFDHHPDAVVSFDTSGQFLSANPACEAISGYRPDELVGRSFAPLLVPEHRILAMAHFQGAVNGSATQYEVCIQHKAGRRVEIGVTNVPIIVRGTVTGVFGIAKELTVQRELEAQLRQAQKMEAVGQLAGGVAHDFNNLLTVIQGNTELVLAELEAANPLRYDLEEVQMAASRAATLTRQLLAFSRQQVLQPRILDVNAVIVDLQKMLVRLIREDIEFTLDLGRDLGAVLADPGQIEQVLVNLVINARDAMPGGGDLIIATRGVDMSPAEASRHGAKPGPYIAVAIRDTGVGMPSDVQARVFEPFFTTKELGGGTGLGLATVYGIVTQSGGFIDMKSAPGRGAVFTVFLPIADAATRVVHRHVPIRATHPRGTEAVLLVEDEDAVRAITRRVLTKHGYSVVEARHGEEALDLLVSQEREIDVVLTDAVMPYMSGPDLATTINEVRPGLPVIIMSGYTDDQLIQRGTPTSDTPFLHKPFTADRLLHIVREALDYPG